MLSYWSCIFGVDGVANLLRAAEIGLITSEEISICKEEAIQLFSLVLV